MTYKMENQNSNAVTVPRVVAQPIPGRLTQFLSTCPKAGKGVHRWVFKASLRLQQEGISENIGKNMIRLASLNCGRCLKPNEIDEAWSSSLAWLDPNRAHPAELRRAKWPSVNAANVSKIVKGGFGLQDLISASPVPCDQKLDSEKVVDALFPGNPLLCVGRSSYDFDTKPREAWRGLLSRRELIVPSPMIALEGLTKTGKRSKHCQDNTGPRWFLVIEFDEGTFDAHAALLWHLKAFAKLMLVVHSGNKSLHGWFDCREFDAAAQEKFMRYAVSLGADPATWNRSQFVRLPGGRRENRTMQKIQYFAPSNN